MLGIQQLNCTMIPITQQWYYEPYYVKIDTLIVFSENSFNSWSDSVFTPSELGLIVYVQSNSVSEFFYIFTSDRWKVLHWSLDHNYQVSRLHLNNSRNNIFLFRKSFRWLRFSSVSKTMKNVKSRLQKISSIQKSIFSV